jgi:hypothetical protein
MSEQRRRGRRPKRGERQFGGPRAPGRQRKPGPKAYGDKLPGTGKGLDPESLREKIKRERWKSERRKKSDKPVTPLGKMKKIGPKPGSMDYFIQETMKPGYKKDRKAMNIGGRANLLEEMGRIDSEKMNPNRRAEKKRVIGELNRGYKKGGLIKGKPKLAKKGWK